jgi:methylmalonyl-CoA mutase N-terminal domain/subunit
LQIDPAIADAQAKSLVEIRATRDADAVSSALAAVGEAARDGGNLLPPMREALRHLATVGEVCDTLRAEFGTYRPPDTF